MEVLILQYAFAVLVCLWWIKPFHKVSLARRFRMPLFNLLCILLLLFIGSYTLIHEIDPNPQTNMAFLAINLILFVALPAGYLYLRNQLYRRGYQQFDLVHLLPGTIFIAFFIVPYLVQSPDAASLSFFNLFGYCTIGIYILLVMKFMLDKYLPSSKFAKKEVQVKREHQLDEPRPGEVMVGSIHLDSEQLSRMDETIRNFLATQQPYLKRGYNLKQLSEGTSIPLHHLSAFINQYYHIHFNDLINEYRVHFCQDKIRNDEWRAKTLEAIAEESGFNNRNTFTAAFKKVTGSNPSDFLKIIKQRNVA